MKSPNYYVLVLVLMFSGCGTKTIQPTYSPTSQTTSTEKNDSFDSFEQGDADSPVGLENFPPPGVDELEEETPDCGEAQILVEKSNYTHGEWIRFLFSCVEAEGWFALYRVNTLNSKYLTRIRVSAMTFGDISRGGGILKPSGLNLPGGNYEIRYFYNSDFSEAIAESGIFYVAAAPQATPAPSPPEDTVDPKELDAFVTGLYRNILRREPNLSGLFYWRNQLLAGVSRESVTNQFLGSDEKFVVDLFVICLRRNPDPSGRAYWVSQFSSKSRQTIRSNFLAVAKQNEAVYCN